MEVTEVTEDTSTHIADDPAAMDDTDGAQPEEPVNGKTGEATAEGVVEDEDDDDEEDDVRVTIGEINSSPAGAPNNFRGMNRFAKGGAGKVAGATEEEIAVIEKQKTTVDLKSEGSIGGVPVKEFDLDSIMDKPWRKPGSDITDYFNYGFNEATWKAYCTKQQNLRVSNGLPAIGHPNFAPDRSAMMESGTAKKPLVIDMEKIREKFNILGDRPKPNPRKSNPPLIQSSGSGTNSIAVIGGSDSTSRRHLGVQDATGIPIVSANNGMPPNILPGIDLSQPPPGFPGAPPSIPPPTANPPAFPPLDTSAFFPPAASAPAAIPTYAPPPFSDPYGTSAVPPGFPQPIASSAPPGWPPAGPPPMGYPITSMGQTAAPIGQRGASPAVKEEEEERRHRRSHSHHKDSSSRHRSPTEESRNRSRSPSSRKDKHKDRERSDKRDKRDKRGSEERESSRSHKKSKKSDKDREERRRRDDDIEIKREPLD